VKVITFPLVAAKNCGRKDLFKIAPSPFGDSAKGIEVSSI
jgi:hypothetical protein